MMEQSKRIRKSGFTLIEVIVVIVIIGILTTIVSLLAVSIQRDQRDTQRRSQAVVISEALETYYDKNGEYPSVPSISNANPTNTGSTVATKLGVDEAVLVFPRTTSGTANSITSAEPAEGQVQYQGVNTTDDQVARVSCETNPTGACEGFKLRWVSEATGEIETIESRRNVGTETIVEGAVKTPVVDANRDGTTYNIIGAVISGNPCEDESLVAEYKIISKSGSGAWSDWNATAWSVTTSKTVAGTPGTTYYFQAMARCADPSAETAPEESAKSEIAEYLFDLAAPTKPAITAAMSGSNAVGTVAAITCSVAGSSPQYQMRSKVNTGAWTAYSTFSTTRTLSLAASEGSRYTFQAQVRCFNSSTSASSSVVPTSEAYIDRPVTAPAAVTVTSSSTTTQSTWKWTAASCTSGTTAKYQYRTLQTSKTTSAWTVATATMTKDRSFKRDTSSQGYDYGFQVRAACVSNVNAQVVSAWSGGSNNSVQTRAIKAPSKPAMGTMGISSASWSGVAASCTGGITRAEYKIRYSLNGAGFTQRLMGTSRTFNYSTLNQGARMRVYVSAQCINTTTNRNSPDSSEDNKTFIRDISKPAAPTFNTTTNWDAGYDYRLEINTGRSNDGCPTGTTLSDRGFEYRARVSWNGDAWSPWFGKTGTNNYGTTSAGFPIEYRYLAWHAGETSNKTTFQFRIQCSSSYKTSDYSAVTEKTITVDCASGRRSFSASPRCDREGYTPSDATRPNRW